MKYTADDTQLYISFSSSDSVSNLNTSSSTLDSVYNNLYSLRKADETHHKSNITVNKKNQVQSISSAKETKLNDQNNHWPKLTDTSSMK